jgi:hypothetical protein
MATVCVADSCCSGSQRCSRAQILQREHPVLTMVIAMKEDVESHSCYDSSMTSGCIRMHTP